MRPIAAMLRRQRPPFDPAGVEQPGEAGLQRRARAADLTRHRHLAAAAPALAVGVRAEQRKHLQVAPLQPPVGHGACGND
ncbi:hypothetical protein EK403_14955 [Hansschlegelia zhihuaiae]|uniref:Uncharacterized protein n=1 Tax=Hansschlegelia zhihuaiae TaxID=405005 RepID=A0A4Q0MGN1_9HYPH|nr:hypothetical protein EK403_14955 [Hansschlegelia zhihuaiae]